MVETRKVCSDTADAILSLLCIRDCENTFVWNRGEIDFQLISNLLCIYVYVDFCSDDEFLLAIAILQDPILTTKTKEKQPQLESEEDKSSNNFS